jgi:hypothetical protein
VDDVLMLRLTNALEPEVARETSAPAKRCNRPGCYAADGFAVNGLELIDSGICQWLHSSAAAEMQGEAPAPSEVIAKVKQLKFASVPKPDRDFTSDPILASDPDSVVFKNLVPLRESAEPQPMPGVEMPGFSIGDEVECTFPDDFSAAERRDWADAFPWGETGTIEGFHSSQRRGRPTPTITAIVRFESGQVRKLQDSQMKQLVF